MPIEVRTIARRFFEGEYGGARLVLAVLLILLLIFLGIAEKPWDLREDINATIEKNGEPSLDQEIAVGLFWAAAANAALCVLLLLTARFWAARFEWPGRRPQGTDPMGRRFFLIALAGAVLLGGALRWNLASRSLWWDELWNVKQTIVGRYGKISHPDEEPRFRPSGMERAFWFYKKPTNHVVASTTGHFTVDAWRKLTGAGEREFSDFAVRFPAFTAALLSIAGIGVLMRRWQFSTAGLVAAFILAVHPLHIRYGIDARSYSFTILFTLAGCLALTRIYHSRGGTWLPWIGFGFCQFLIVWNSALAVYVAGGLGLAAIVIVKMRAQDRRQFTPGMCRIVAVNVLALMAFIQLFAPNLLQMRRWVNTISSTDPHLISFDLFRDTLVQYFFGIPWTRGEQFDGRESPHMEELFTHSFMGWGLLLVAVVLVVTGMARAAVHRRGLFVLLTGLWLAGVTQFVTTYVLKQYYYERFVIFLLVPIVLSASLGATALGSRRTATPWRSLAVGMVFFALFATLVREKVSFYLVRPYAPLRDVAEFLEAKNADKKGRAVVAGYGLGGGITRIYYPQAIFTSNRDDVQAALDIADKEQRPLFLFFRIRDFQPRDFAGWIRLDRRQAPLPGDRRIRRHRARFSLQNSRVPRQARVIVRD